MRKIAILGTGSYFPGKPIENDELMHLAKVSFDKEKIEITKNELLEEKEGISLRILDKAIFSPILSSSIFSIINRSAATLKRGSILLSFATATKSRQNK